MMAQSAGLYAWWVCGTVVQPLLHARLIAMLSCIILNAVFPYRVQDSVETTLEEDQRVSATLDPHDS
jgi:hypothetical protein